MRQHLTNAPLPDDAADEDPECARLGAAIPWIAAPPAMPIDDVLLTIAGDSGDSTPQIKS
jgi:hypothetical protein